MMTRCTSPVAIVALLWVAVVVTCLAAYWPGLHGDFLFDDFGNLPTLGAQGPVNRWATFWQYVTSGHADPTGRPLSLLSFLIDAHDWPAAPYPFKRTNLIIHLLNGTLLAWLLARLGGASGSAGDRRAAIAGVLAAALWLLHPLLVSTTLYVVQREAMLAATMTLVGLLLWLTGRRAMLAGCHTSGWLWMTAGLWGGTLAGFLCKANGLLLPALALTLDATVIRHLAERRTPAGEPANAEGKQVARRTLYLLAAPPTALLVVYLAHAGYVGIVHGIASIRPWTLGERLLTEPRVLVDYLRLLWLPRPFTSGVFNDQFAASTSLVHPASTLPALLGIAALIAGAVATRRRWPVLAASLLFYFVAQSMESTTIALELYFEHRNYLPAMLMFWPLAWWICATPASTRGIAQAPQGAASRHRLPALRIAIAVALVAMLAVMTHARADLWGDTRDQSLLWARLNPASPRAQAYAAMTEMRAGHPDLAVHRLAPVLRQYPHEVQVALNLLSAECQMGHVDTSTLTAAETALRESRDPGGLLASWFGRVIDQSSHPTCPELDVRNISALLEAARSNPRLAAEPGRLQDLLSLQGQLALHDRHGAQALADFDRALDMRVNAGTAFQQAAMLGSAGFPALGLAHLDHYESVKGRAVTPAPGMPRIHAWVLREQGYWHHELVHLRHTLSTDASNNEQK